MDEKQFPALTRRDIFMTLWGGVPPSFIAPALLLLALTFAFIYVSERNYHKVMFSVNERRIARDHMDVIESLQMALLNAETAQRGYLLTGNQDYLKPLNLARIELPKLQSRLAAMLSIHPEQQMQVNEIAALIFDNFTEVDTTLKLVDQGRRDEALAIFNQNSGKEVMDRIRQKITALSADMSVELEEVRQGWERDMLVSRLSMLAVAILNLLLLVFALYMFIKDLKQRQMLIALRETENQRLTKLVDARTGELNELSTHLQRSTEEDRAALARDLHDELGGILTSAKMDLEWLRTHATHAPEALKRFVQLSEMLDDAVSVKRRVVENLRPSLLDNLGLAPALEWYITENCSKGGLTCTLNLAEELGVISPDASIALFRIVQEGTTNALRHAKAKNFSASLHIEGKNIHLVLEDDGQGLPGTFNPAKMSHGLSGIRQRARSLGGDAIWKSAPGKGTVITVIIPRSVDEADVDSLGETAALT
jgi:signal transduction histidine kinase